MGEPIGGPLPGASGTLAPRTRKRRLEPYPAVWYTAKGGNDTAWRAEFPAAAVGGKVSYVKEKQFGRAVSYPNKDTGLPWQIDYTLPDGDVVVARTKKDAVRLGRERLRYTSLKVVFPEHEGAAVFTRPCLARATLARYMRENGIRTIAETDDNYFSNPKFNLFLRQQGFHKELTDTHAKAFATMDACVFSTEWLRDRYWQEFRKRFGDKKTRTVGGMPDLFVARNCIPRDHWPVRDEGDGRIRVGFMGSPSHVWDVNIAFQAFYNAHGLAGVETVCIGYNPGNPDPDLPDTVVADGVVHRLRSKKSLDYQAKWGRVIDKHIKWIDPGRYHRAPLPIDIGLAPLRTDDFTLGKSDSKAVEYTISGAAVVCSRMPVFTQAGWVDGVNCLMADSQREMAEQTIRLVRDDGLRAELVTAAQDMVRNERNEAVMRDEWMAAIQG